MSSDNDITVVNTSTGIQMNEEKDATLISSDAEDDKYVHAREIECSMLKTIFFSSFLCVACSAFFCCFFVLDASVSPSASKEFSVDFVRMDGFLSFSASSR